MTDMTSDLAREATDAPKVRRAPPKREYYAYFGVIFAATLPLACVTWVLKAGRQMSLPEKDPISAAWSQARIITPMIFSA